MRAPASVRELHRHDRLRLALVEHVPWTGRAVRLAMAIAPPPREEADPAPDEILPPVTPRTLDWSGRDLLLITVDALRADHLGAYGYTRPTSPHFDALAREGTSFLHAYCSIPHTSYSLVSLMTGKYIHPLFDAGVGADSVTLARELRNLGYQTAAFYPPAVFYVDTDRFDGFRENALDFAFHVEEFATPTGRAQQVHDYLATIAADRPAFVWVHFFEPHEPYERHPEHDFGDADIDVYDSEVAATDDGIDEVVRAMRAVRPNAIIVITADHGEEFDEHGGRFHGTTTYEEQVRVPLLIVGPGIEGGRQLALAVQTIDLFPTFTGALGIARPSGVRGRDLGAVLSGLAADQRGVAWAEADAYEMLADGPYRLVCQRASAACELFDVTVDPLEMHDQTPLKRGEAKRLRATLTAYPKAQP
jgi:arylsulfatase A-like enzyme